MFMETYDFDVLIKMWETEKISEVQVIGQLLLHGKAAADILRSLEITIPNLKIRVEKLEKRQTALEKRLDALERLLKRRN